MTRPRNRTSEGGDSKEQATTKKKSVTKKKKRGGTVEEKDATTTWSPEATKNADDFVQRYANMGADGVRAEFRADIAAYRSPTYGDAASRANAAKNRHKEQVTCLDQTRVALPENKYINASWYYDADKLSRQYILTQAPLESTIEDFWKMAFEHKVMAVVVMCDMKENGQDVCPEFWPVKDGDAKTYGSMWIANKKHEIIHKETVWTLEVLPEGCSNSQILTIVKQNQWDTPFTQANARALLKIIRILARLSTLGTVGPIAVIDEYSGISRGAILTLVDFYTARMYKGEKGLVFVDFVKWARRQRNGMVRNDEDYLAVIKTIFEYLYRLDSDKYKTQFERVCGKPDDLN